MRSPIDYLERRPRRSPYGSDLPVARTVQPSKRRARLVTISLMAIAAAATGVFIQLKLAQKPAGGASDSASVVTEAKADVEVPASHSALAPVPVKTVTIPAPGAGDQNAAEDRAVDAGTLDHNNPRWVRVDKTSRIAVAAIDAATAVKKEAGALSVAKPVEQAFASPETDDDPGSDNQWTAAIPPLLRNAPVQSEAPKADEDTGRSANGTVKVQRAVNLRAAPVSGSRVIKVLRAGSMVGLVGCKGWCEVTHEGSRGYIYQSFIRSSDRTAGQMSDRPVEKTAAAAKPAAKKTVQFQAPVRDTTSSRR